MLGLACADVNQGEHRKVLKLLCCMQGTREVEGLVFKMTSELGKLKRKVDVLGTAKDTVQHRYAWTAAAEQHQAGQSCVFTVV